MATDSITCVIATSAVQKVGLKFLVVINAKCLGSGASHIDSRQSGAAAFRLSQLSCGGSLPRMSGPTPSKTASAATADPQDMAIHTYPKPSLNLHISSHIFTYLYIPSLSSNRRSLPSAVCIVPTTSFCKSYFYCSYVMLRHAM